MILQKENLKTQIAFSENQLNKTLMDNKTQIIIKIGKWLINIWKRRQFMKSLNLMLVDGTPMNMNCFFKLSEFMERTGT